MHRLATYSGTDFQPAKVESDLCGPLQRAPCDAAVQHSISVCNGHIMRFTESTDWVTRGSAYWDPNGWVEMTGISNGQKGAVYNKVESIASGVASIRFTLKTGNGLNGGADGFAFTIINISSVEDLDNWISQHNRAVVWATVSVESLAPLRVML